MDYSMDNVTSASDGPHYIHDLCAQHTMLTGGSSPYSFEHVRDPRKSSFSKRRRASGSRVNFHPEVICYRSGICEDEVDPLWYSKAELAVFKEERKSIVRALKRVNFDHSRIDKNKYCLRGLEAYSSLTFNKVMHKKRVAVLRNVLAEQNKQRSEKEIDAEKLRIISETSTEWAREQALELGWEDSKDKALQEEVAPFLRMESSDVRMETTQDDDWGMSLDCGVSVAPSVVSTSTRGSHSTTSTGTMSLASFNSLPYHNQHYHDIQNHQYHQQFAPQNIYHQAQPLNHSRPQARDYSKSIAVQQQRNVPYHNQDGYFNTRQSGMINQSVSEEYARSLHFMDTRSSTYGRQGDGNMQY